ncbi:hypothetical protein GOODEAATRI_019461 [Goodea atripinnis]|uniref:Uncharacterized protein n=1 Tax=Goodea atripinnis TaxID=208336 RepID=A0ABV0NLV1_9TELE
MACPDHREASENNARYQQVLEAIQAVSNLRAAFTEMKNLLRGCGGVHYGLRHPATEDFYGGCARTTQAC